MHLDATLIRADVSWGAVVDAHADAVLAEAGELRAREAPASAAPASSTKAERICRTDPDASLGKGGRTSRVEPAYTQYTAVDAMRGVVLDVEVTGGAVHDTNGMSALDAVPLRRADRSRSRRWTRATRSRGCSPTLRHTGSRRSCRPATRRPAGWRHPGAPRQAGRLARSPALPAGQAPRSAQPAERRGPEGISVERT